jgi:hypothetical protein
VYYAVQGSLTWETTEGSLEITPSPTGEEMHIKFKFSAEEGGGGTGKIWVSGNGDFKGRMPWTLATGRVRENRSKSERRAD